MNAHECKPTDCDLCSSKDLNPICSVHGPWTEIQKVRSASKFKAGQTIFYAGNNPLGLYTIQNGLVKLESVSTEGQAHTLRLMGPGSALGYRSLFSDEAYRATAVAVEDVTLCFIPRATIMTLVQSSPEMAMKMLKQLSDDLRVAEDKWVTQVDKDASSRIAEALLFLDENFRDQSWTRREIAQWAGTTPETVMRTLALFEKSAWIRAEGRIYHILNRPALTQKSSGT